jgi:hypothetical protein
MKGILKNAFINAIATAIYVILVGSFIYFIGASQIGNTKSAFIPIAILMLLVFSVALVGSLIFGRPVLWYIDKKKKEAIILLMYTLVIFFIITIVVFLLLFLFINGI